VVYKGIRRAADVERGSGTVIAEPSTTTASGRDASERPGACSLSAAFGAELRKSADGVAAGGNSCQCDREVQRQQLLVC
jgi:hypothetical protein